MLKAVEKASSFGGLHPGDSSLKNTFPPSEPIMEFSQAIKVKDKAQIEATLEFLQESLQ